MPTIVYDEDKIATRQFIGLNVRQVRELLREVMVIPIEALPFVRWKPVAEGHRLTERDKLEFITPDQDVGQVWTGEQFCALFSMAQEDLEMWIENGLPVLRLKDGSVRVTETVVDDFFRKRKVEVATTRIAESLERIANALAPAPANIVGSQYVAEKRGVTTTYVAQMARQGLIPKSCIVAGSGDGNYWKFNREKIDQWIESGGSR